MRGLLPGNRRLHFWSNSLNSEVNQSSRRRGMCLEQAHRLNLGTKPSDFSKLQIFKRGPISNHTWWILKQLQFRKRWAYLPGYLDATNQDASFYVERNDLASKFSDTHPSNLIIGKFTHAVKLFSLQKSKTANSLK